MLMERKSRVRRAKAQPVVPEAALDPVLAAKVAGLHYVGDNEPGIRRKTVKGGFDYIGPDNRPVRNAEELERIRKLGIPPAWTDVWICPDPQGHLQATGRDARGRKQYRYHAEWRRVRDETKYERMLAFGEALPKIRARVDADLALPGLPREKVLATVVRLLETTLIRIGNEEYARTNESYGLTTMRDDHVQFGRGAVEFNFRGKSGKEHTRKLRDARLARIVRACRDIPGQELFQYKDPDGSYHAIGSADVNAYLKDITGQPFTAKDFRTWAGTVLAAIALHEFEQVDTKAGSKQNLKQAIEHVAGQLGNTPAICRKCYVHPEIQAAYLDPDLAENLRGEVDRKLRAIEGMRSEEAAVLAFLRNRLAEQAEAPPEQRKSA